MIPSASEIEDIMVRACRASIFFMASLVATASVCAQETCSEEVKLLLSPAQPAAHALTARDESHEVVYFFDTPALDLLSKGLILRMRKGSDTDLTVKLRPLAGEKFVDPSQGRERYKCEVDLNAGVENQSYSVQSNSVPGTIPETGEELFSLLSDGQKKLLADSQIPVDWKTVKRVAEIQSTSWTMKSRPPLGRLSLELWQWPDGSVLELSTKSGTDSGQSTYAEMKELAQKKGLELSPDQRSKTAIALGKIVPSARR